jgi:hypothetical protein
MHRASTYCYYFGEYWDDGGGAVDDGGGAGCGNKHWLYLLSISVSRGSDNGCCSYNTLRMPIECQSNANRMLTRHIKSKH